MDIMKYINIAWFHKWVVFTCVVVIVTIIGVYSFLATPIYETNCKILITENSSQELLGEFAMVDIMNQKMGASDPLNTHIELFLTRPVLNEVIERKKIFNADGTPIKLKKFRKSFDITPVRNTNIISISYVDKNPVFAAEVLNTLAEVYIKNNQKLNQEEMRSARQFIEDQLTIKRNHLSEVEKKVLLFKKVQNTVSIAQETQSHVENLSKLEIAEMDLSTKIKGGLARKKDLQSKINKQGAINNPFYAYWLRSLEQTKSEITNLTAQKTNIENQIEKINKKLHKLPSKEVDLAKLLREERIANEIYTNLLSKYEEIRINEAAKVASVKLIEPAIVSTKPISPKKRKNIMLATVLGMVLGIGIALLLDYIDESPKSVADVKNILPYSQLGSLPYSQDESILYMMHDKNSRISESMRLIQANLMFKDIMKSKSISMMMTSALPSEGKTTTIANLGITMASSGKKVVIVDLDLRKPSIHRIFSIKTSNRGITDYLWKKATLKDIIWHTKEKNLDIIPVSKIPQNPTELIVSNEMIKLIDELKSMYDVVLIDSAPVTIVAETLSFVRHVDGLILVVDVKHTSIRALSKMQELFEDKKLPIIGTIINKHSKETGEYVYNSYYSANTYTSAAA